jgi:Histidine kinase-, DNA gyrase B-, and HSP90-like ATPase
MSSTTSDSATLEQVPTNGSVRLAPDPRSLDALGRNHTLEAALAELVDNSLDANAAHVLIRFVRDGRRLVRLLVIDDGAGIEQGHIDVAMTIGGARDYGAGEIGRFGLGLKAASFSQASEVTVVSRSPGGTAVGRRWELELARRDYTCAIVEPQFAERQLERDWGLPHSASGTIVRWDDVHGFPSAEEDVDRFLQSAFARICGHVGLVFHRLLETEAFKVCVQVEDSGELLTSTEVAPLDPFAYARSGAVGWPKTLPIGDGPRRLEIECHIWPGRASGPEFRLDGNLLERQGLYVYHNDRLVQRGGWNGLRHPDKQLNLARARVDISGDVPQMLSLRPEKSGVEVGPAFAATVAAAVTRDGYDFEDYLDCARDTRKEVNRRKRDRVPLLPLGAGFDPKLRAAFKAHVPSKDHEDPVDIRWSRLEDDEFFFVDRERSTLWLNARYRDALLGGRDARLNDVPVIKALMFLLVENIFAGQNLGPRDKDNLEIWQAILTSAAGAEHG